MSDPRPAPPELSEAAAWFVRLGHRSITTRALRDFRDWRDDPANDAAYQEIEAAWTRTGGLARDPDILRATDAALARRPSRTPREWLQRPWLGWAVAMATVALTAATILVMTHGAPTYATGVGEQRLVRLADGSRLHLNTDSRVKVDFGRGERRLTLARGEALFDVAHDPQRPFIVAAGAASVRATGTKFDVRREDGTVRVSLLQGSVRVRRDDRPGEWTLAPNQQLTVSKSGASAPRAIDAARTTSWTTGRLMFHETPLAAAVAEVNRYADRKVELDGEGLGGRRLNGVFDAGDTDAFVAGVSALFDLKATPGPGGSIRLRPADPAAAG